jgi:hypothetical protein
MAKHRGRIARLMARRGIGRIRQGRTVRCAVASTAWPSANGRAEEQRICCLGQREAVRQEQAQGDLIAVLGVLAAHSGYGEAKRAS